MNDKSVMGEVCLNQLSEISYRQSAYSLHHDKKQVKNASRKTIRPQVNQQDQAWPTSAGVTLSHSNGSPFLRELFETCSSRLRQRFGSASTRSRRLPEEHPKNSRRNTEENNTQVQSILEKPANLGARLYRPTAISCQPSAKVSSQKKKVFKYQEEAVNMQAFNKSKKSTQFDRSSVSIRPGVASGDSIDLGADSFGTRCQLLRETAHRVRHQLRSNWLRGERTGRREVKPYTLYLITLKILFCVCLANARQQDGFSLSGKVLSAATGMALEGATVGIKESDVSVLTDSKGVFGFRVVPDRGTLVVSYVGYKRQELKFDGREAAQLTIRLAPEENSLDEAVVIAYGTTTRRLNTGSVSRVTAEDIARQPVTNVLSALSGRMPGVFVQTTNGLPGGNINVQIRGRGSIAAGTSPLYIIDGVPFDGNTYGEIGTTNQSPVNGVISPLNSLNPSDIESITVLKDADATAIYGSRGANGVMLIVTKRGSGKRENVSFNLSRGINQVANLPKLLGLEEYLEIRREAFENSGQVPNASNAPDLLLYDQRLHTDWPDYFFGRTASFTDAQLGFQGGSDRTFYNLSFNYHTEGNVVSERAQYDRGGLFFSLRHTSPDGKFELTANNAFNLDNNESPNIQNASVGLYLPPNFPAEDGNGHITVRNGNPLMEMNATAKAKTGNLVSNITATYHFVEGLYAKVSAGVNRANSDQVQLFPKNSTLSGDNYAKFARSARQSMLVEPQLNYKTSFNRLNVDALIGATYQESNSDSQFLQGSNYTNDGLLENIASAGVIDSRLDYYTRYRFVSLFGRLSFHVDDKYLLNATVRRDGSSRFGDNNRYGNFASVGAAWLFTKERFFLRLGDLISFGKLRMSYGITGNDQISDYQYLSTYQNSGYAYLGMATLVPGRIYNSAFKWETTAKYDVGLELGLFNDRIFFSANYYINRSRDQLVNYTLPFSTGFSSYQANLPAVVENKGWEFEWTSTNINKQDFSWRTSINLTVPRNRLVSFENFETSSYAASYELGYDISRIQGYLFLGVDPQTGSAIYGDENGNPTSTPYNNHTIGKSTPEFYGGIANDFTYKRFSLNVFCQFVDQMGFGGLRNSLGLLPNSYAFMADRWRNPGDITDIPKAMSVSDFYYTLSSANYYNASYLRLKNLSVGYSLPQAIAKRLGMQRIELYFRGQNLITFWNKDVPVLDPESGGYTGVGSVGGGFPPMKTFIFGFNVTL